MSAEPQTPLGPALRALAPVELGEVVDQAPAMTRMDRKYLVDRRVAEEMLRGVAGSFRVLAIDGRRSTTYRSTYFDTPDLATCRAHVQRRRRRWKVRSRLYVEDDLCRVEVKSKDGRGSTAKVVRDSHPDRYGLLADDDAAFVSETLARQGIDADVGRLVPSVETHYRRATLADTEQSVRLTLDWDVRCVLGGHQVWVDHGFVLVETKGGLRPSDADRALVQLGARARSFSKYASTAALLRDDIPDNDVRRLHGRQLHSGSLSMVGAS